jgi:hypothetical protein
MAQVASGCKSIPQIQDGHFTAPPRPGLSSGGRNLHVVLHDDELSEVLHDEPLKVVVSGERVSPVELLNDSVQELLIIHNLMGSIKVAEALTDALSSADTSDIQELILAQLDSNMPGPFLRVAVRVGENGDGKTSVLVNRPGERSAVAGSEDGRNLAVSGAKHNVCAHGTEHSINGTVMLATDVLHIGVALLGGNHGKRVELRVLNLLPAHSSVPHDASFKSCGAAVPPSCIKYGVLCDRMQVLGGKSLTLTDRHFSA